MRELDGRYSVVSFFAGCGGLDLGFRGSFRYMGATIPRTRFDLSRAYDFSERAIATYEANLGRHAEVADLARAKVREMPAADLLLGGFPCQEFSRCGPRKGLASERGSLYKAMVRYARQHKPRLVVAENVADLLYINDGWDFEVIRAEFSRAGYKCVQWSVNAADYGVPQNRRRVFVVFIRKDLPGAPEFPASDRFHRRSISWAIEDLESVTDESVPNQSQYFKAGVAGKGHGQGDEVSKADEPSYTIRANAKSRIQFHYSLPRRLTVRECARIQTFPDDFSFGFPATESIRQIGNAVPPVLANIVAVALAKYLKKLDRDVSVHATA